MNYSISSDKRTLTIKVTAAEQAELGDVAAIQSDDAMYDFLEPIVRNSELEWIPPEQTGDLTSAPMLGIYGDETTRPVGRYLGHYNGVDRFQPVVARWAFMDYQVASLLEKLRDTGEVCLVGGELVCEAPMLCTS